MNNLYVKHEGILKGMTDTTTVKLPLVLRNRLAARAKKRHVSQAELLGEALDALDQRDFWSSVSKSYARLQADPQEWNEYLAERDAWLDAPMDSGAQ